MNTSDPDWAWVPRALKTASKGFVFVGLVWVAVGLALAELGWTIIEDT